MFDTANPQKEAGASTQERMERYVAASSSESKEPEVKSETEEPSEPEEITEELVEENVETEEGCEETESEDETTVVVEDEPEVNHNDDSGEDKREIEGKDAVVEELLDLKSNGNKLVEITVNGETTKVTLEEAVKGHQLERDYRQKTSDHSLNVKKFETNRDASLKELDLALTVAADQVAPFVKTPDELEKIRKTQGTEAYLDAKASTDRGQQIYQQRLAVVNEQNNINSAALKENQENCAKELTSKHPEIISPENAGKLSSYLESSGVSRETQARIVDVNSWVIADKAMKYDEMMASKSKVLKKVDKTPKVPKKKPSLVSKPVKPKTSIARQRLRETGKGADEAFFELLNRNKG